MSQNPIVLVSQEDRSVNFVFPNGQEARYVRRTDDYFIVYLSSHGGCNQACRFCHLTQTKQVEMVPATLEELLLQMRTVVNYYAQRVKDGLEPKAQRVHLNFMARGEPLLSPVVTLPAHWETFVQRTMYHCVMNAKVVDFRWNISTTMPAEMEDSRFGLPIWTAERTYVFYSLYSISEKFRKRWLPKAMSVNDALARLYRWQSLDRAHRKIILHWALIEGENDSIMEAYAIADKIKASGIAARFNLVRYNPYSEVQGKEPPEDVINAYFHAITTAMTVEGSRIVPRVGFDVKASCGTFVNFADDPSVIPIQPE